MIRSVLLAVIVALILPHLTACVTHREGRAPATQVAGPTRQITGVTTTAGNEVAFDRPRPPEEVAGEVRPAVAAARIVGDSLIATARGDPYRIALTDTREIWFEESSVSALRTAGLLGGIALGVYLTLGILFTATF